MKQTVSLLAGLELLSDNGTRKTTGLQLIQNELQVNTLHSIYIDTAKPSWTLFRAMFFGFLRDIERRDWVLFPAVENNLVKILTESFFQQRGQYVPPKNCPRQRLMPPKIAAFSLTSFLSALIYLTCMLHRGSTAYDNRNYSIAVRGCPIWTQCPSILRPGWMGSESPLSLSTWSKRPFNEFQLISFRTAGYSIAKITCLATALFCTLPMHLESIPVKHWSQN